MHYQEAQCSDHSDGGRDSPAVSGTADDEKKSKQLPRKEVTACCYSFASVLCATVVVEFPLIFVLSVGICQLCLCRCI